MVDSKEFVQTIRKGVRKGNHSLVVSVLVKSSQKDVCQDEDRFTRVGFVVAKRQIPRAVDRNKVKRRLRHLLRERLSSLPEGSWIVVRALTNSVSLDYAQLGQSLDRALQPAVRQAVEKSKESQKNCSNT